MKITGWWSQEYPWYFLTDIESKMLLRHFTPWPLQPGTTASFPGWGLGEIRAQHTALLCFSGCVLHVDFRDGWLHTGILTQERNRDQDHPFPGSPPLPLWLQVSLNIHCWWEAPCPGGHRGKEAGFRLRQMWGWIWPHILLPVWPLSNSCISLGLSVLLHKIEWLPYKIDISIKW